MPTTLAYRPTLIDGLISNDRLNSYKLVFNPANDVELMGVYLWNTHVCGALYPIIGTAEIALRNAIDQALTAGLGRFWWSTSSLMYKSFVLGAQPPKPVKAVRDGFSRAAEKFQTERQRRYKVKERVVPDHHGIVAATEFSVWGFLLDSEFMGNSGARPLIWPQHLGTVFSGPWPSTNAKKTLSYARDLVSAVRIFRNRLYHYEPAWKGYGVLTEADAIAHLHEKIDKIISLLALIHPENVKLLDKNGLLSSARRACTSGEIRRFQHMATTHKINSIQKLSTIIDTCAASNSVFKICISRGSAQKVLIVPDL